MTTHAPYTPTPNPSAPTTPSLVIVGGGHVGLSFALLLAHHGIDSTVLEKTTYPTVSPSQDEQRRAYLDSRNTALSRRTVQIYQEIGLWERLASHACQIDRVKIYEKGSFGQATLNKEQEGVESFGQVMENAHLGYELMRAVKDSPLITLIDGVQVHSLSQDDKGVTLGLDNGEQVFAPLVVACDGQHSSVRQLLGVGADSYDYHQVGVVGVIETDKAHEHTAIECFGRVGPLALLPLPDVSDGTSRRSVVWICRMGEEREYLDNDEHFASVIQATFGDKAGKVLSVGRRGAYPLVKVLAQKQVVGRCVLMGNAAHTLHPVAGQGFNLCMRDTHELAKRLAKRKANGQDLGEPAHLLAYEKERLPDQKRVAFFCDVVVKTFAMDNALVRFIRNVGLIFFDKVPMIKPLVAKFAMGLKKQEV